MSDALIRPATSTDCEAIAGIYNHYIATTIITFEEEPVDAAEINARLAEVAAASLPWLVMVKDDRVIGYAYAGKWRGRVSYRYSVESSIYLDAACTGQGLGIVLYRELLRDLRSRSLHVVIGGISLPNPASVALHEKLGFEKVAQFKEVGFKLNRWIDVGYWQASLEDKGAPAK